MLSSLVDGYGSSDSGSDDDSVQKTKAPAEQSPAKPEHKSTDQFNDVEPSGATGPGSMLPVCECMCVKMLARPSCKMPSPNSRVG